MIAFPCPKCQATLKAPDGKGGMRTKCPKCGSAVRVPAVPAPIPAAPPPQPTPAPGSLPVQHAIVFCPHCQQSIVQDDRFAGRTVACPHCNQLVQMPTPQDAAAAPIPRPQVGGGVAPPPRAEPAWQNLDRGDDRPVRRRRSRVLSCLVSAIVIPVIIVAAVAVAFVVLENTVLAPARIDRTPSVQVAPSAGVRFGDHWEKVYGKNLFGRTLPGVQSTVTNTGTEKLNSYHFSVECYDSTGKKLERGAVSFPELRPGESADVIVSTPDEETAVVKISRSAD